MKRFVWTILLFCSFAAIAQEEEQEEKELQKMMEKAEKLAEEMKKDPRYKKAMEEEEEGERASKSFPAKDKSLWATLPAKPLTTAAMKAYVQQLSAAYKTRMSPASVSAAKEVLARMTGNADKVGQASAAAWYNKAYETSILLALDAAALKPEDPLLLNNLGALMNMAGAARHSLPILRTLGFRYPNNPMILNNIGQAFAGVGETDTAMKYFVRCLKRSPHHPEANNTAGQIEKVKGNTEQAKSYFQNALKGGYHAEAIKGLREAGGSNYAQWLPLPGSPINVPYFNEFKYQLPRECTGPADAPYIKGEHEAFIKFVEGVAAAYQTAGNDEQRQGQVLLDKESATLKASVMEALNSGKGFTSMPEMGSPINRAAIKKYNDLMLGAQVNELPEHDRQMERLKNVYDGLIRRYEEDKKKLADDFVKKRSPYNCGEGRSADCAAIDKLAKEECQLMVQLGNTAQSRITAAKLDMQQERLRVMRWQLNTSAYYGYLSGFNKHMARGAFYLAASKYLRNLAELAYNPYVCAGKTCREEPPVPASKNESDGIHDMDCPIDIDVPFIVGKLALNCEKFTFTAGEGLVFKAEKNFVTKQSTMTLGIGLQFQGSKEWGVFSGEASASASQAFYIVWDKDDNMIDAGLAFQAEGSIKGEAKAETPFGIGDDYLQKELKAEGEFGYTLGINSGWTFNDASLNAMVQKIGNLLSK